MIFCSFICSMKSNVYFASQALESGCLALLFRMLKSSGQDLKGFACFAMAAIYDRFAPESELLTTWQVTKLIDELVSPELTLSIKAKLAFVLSSLHLKHHNGCDFVKLVGLLSKLSCDVKGLKSPIQPPQQGVLKRIERFSAGLTGAVTQSVVLEDVRREEVVASDDVTLFGYLGTFIEYPVEQNLHWRVVSGLIIALKSFLLEALDNRNFAGVTQIPLHLHKLSGSLQKLLKNSIGFSQMHCIIFAFDLCERLMRLYEAFLSIDYTIRYGKNNNFKRFLKYFTEASARLELAQGTHRCYADLLRWRSLRYLTASVSDNPKLEQLSSTFDYVVMVAAADCCRDSKHQNPNYTAYCEQVRFLFAYLSEHTLRAMRFVESSSNISEDDLSYCFHKVTRLFCLEGTHGGDPGSLQSIIAGAPAPGKVRCLSILLDKTLSPFRAHYSAEEVGASQVLIFRLCRDLCDQIGILSLHMRVLMRGKYTLFPELFDSLEWIYSSLLEVVRSLSWRRWNQAQKEPHADHSPLCANTACGLTSLVETKACSGCDKVFYCSVVCQKMHWKKHKAVCARADRAAASKQQELDKLEQQEKQQEEQQQVVAGPIDAAARAVVDKSAGAGGAEELPAAVDLMEAVRAAAEQEAITGYSVRQLKEAIAAKGSSCAMVLEKSDLRAILQQLLLREAVSTATGKSKAGGGGEGGGGDDGGDGHSRGGGGGGDGRGGGGGEGRDGDGGDGGAGEGGGGGGDSAGGGGDDGADDSRSACTALYTVVNLGGKPDPVGSRGTNALEPDAAKKAEECSVQQLRQAIEEMGGSSARLVERSELIVRLQDLALDSAFQRVYNESLIKTFLNLNGRLPTEADKEGMKAIFKQQVTTGEGIFEIVIGFRNSD